MSEAADAGRSICERVRVVLCHPSDPRNVGGAARAVANFGLGELRVVSAEPFHAEDIHAYSAGAVTRVTLRHFTHVDEAIGDCDRVIGTSRRSRDPDAPPQWPVAGLAARLDTPGSTALMFGTERTGLTKAELDRCQAVVHIHTSDIYPSMNLAHAVACVGYELARPTPGESGPPIITERPRMNAAAREAFFGFVQSSLESLGYPPGRSAAAFTRRLRKILARANPDQQELSLFGGVFSELLRLGQLAGVAEPNRAPDAEEPPTKGADQPG